MTVLLFPNYHIIHIYIYCLLSQMGEDTRTARNAKCSLLSTPQRYKYVHASCIQPLLINSKEANFQPKQKGLFYSFQMYRRGQWWSLGLIAAGPGVWDMVLWEVSLPMSTLMVSIVWVSSSSKPNFCWTSKLINSEKVWQTLRILTCLI